MNFNEWFLKYYNNLGFGGRDQTMKKALELFIEKKGQIIVETGTIHPDWGAGQSTLVFADFCKTFNHHLFTIDIDHQTLEDAKTTTQPYRQFVTYVENDSVSLLKGFNQKIDLLYLDSMDCDEYDSPESLELIKSQIHQEREIKMAYDKLSDNAIVLLDDANFYNGGKCRLSRQFLKEKGWKEIIKEKQSLWIR